MLPGLAPASSAMSRIETALKPRVENNSSAALRMASRMFGFRVIGCFPCLACARWCLLFAELGEDRHDLLFAVDDFSQETGAIDVAILVPACFHQNSRRGIRLQRQSFHGGGKG